MIVEPTSAYDLNQYGFEQSGKYITQTFLIQAPTLIPLTFSYCNGLSCGNPDDPELGCYVNLYNPNFTNELPKNLIIGALPAGASTGKPVKLYAKSGQLAGPDLNYGYYDPVHTADWNKTIFRSAPVFGSDGSVTLQFSQGPFDEFVRAKLSPKGRVCGLNDEELRAFRAKYGEVFNNTDRATIKIAIIWEMENPEYANPVGQQLQQNLTIDTSTRVLSQTLSPSTPPQERTKVFRQTDRQWSNLTNGETQFSETGTIPTTLANLLARYDATSDPSLVAKDLLTKGLPWETGLSWQQLANYLENDKKIHVTETTAFGTLQHLAQQQPVLTALTNKTKDGARESLIVIESYNPTKDRFTIIDPVRGSTTMSWQELMQGAPWFLTVQK